MPENPKAFDDYLKAANHVLDNTKGIPKVAFTGCAGLLLVEAHEIGFALSGGGGAGVLVGHKHGKWSSPVAINVVKAGAGAVFGYADRDTVVVLNHFAMKRFLDGSVKLSLAEDIGAAAGPVGASAESAIAASENAGGATAFVYTTQKGVLLNVEVTSSLVLVKEDVNNTFYGTKKTSDIVEGKATPPDGSGVPDFMKKVEKL